MSKLPEGWTLYEPRGRDARMALYSHPRVEVEQCHDKRATISVYGDPFYADELEALFPIMQQAVAIARQWDEERGAK